MIDLQDPARFLRHRHVRAEHAGQEAAEHDESSNKTLHEPFASLFLSLAQLLRDVGFEPIGENADVLVPLADEWTRPWARVEERALKTVLGWAAARSLAWAPWFESYARAIGKPMAA